MNLKQLFIGLIAIFSIIATGCSNELGNHEQKIKVQKRIGEEYKFQDFKEVSDNKKVLKVKDILNDADWENAKVNMSHPPDFQFVFLFKNPDIVQERTDLYKVWISPNNDNLEIVQNDNKYVKLSKERSEILFEFITGVKLFDFK